MYSRSCYRFTQLAFAVVLLAPLGCAHVNLVDWVRGVPEASEKNPVFNIVSVWEPSEGRNTDGLPTRGFAGQLFFFTRSSATPVKVNGDVRVYVFDDQGTAEEQSKPIHQFDFIGDAWTAHLQDSTLGPSYNVFIPYTREGQWQANCQLRLRLTSESGQVVHSEVVEVALPGSPRPGSQEVITAGDTASPPPVGQPLAAQLRPPVEPIQYGATMRHETVRSMVVNSGSPPTPAYQMPTTATPTAAMPAARMPAATTMAGPAPRRFRLAGDATAASTPNNAASTPNNIGLGESGRPVMPTAATEMMNQPPHYQPVRYQPVVYQVEANGPTSTRQGGAAGRNTGAAHPFASQAAVRHPLADALQ